MSFMKLMRVASMLFAAYLVISAEVTSMKITRKLFSRKGRYSRLISSFARSLSTPTTTRSGLMKSLMALPSFRNSGLEATSNSTSAPRRASSCRTTC